MKRRLVHLVVGHIPYFVYFENKDKAGEYKVYKCTLCGKYLHSGPYNRLYEQ